MKRLCALGVSLLVLALALGAGNAAADDGSGSGGQTAIGSAGTVQVGSVDASPATAVNAPVNANAPVSVGSLHGSCGCKGDDGKSTATQTSSGSTAETSKP